MDRDEPLFEISTDKVDAEIPSPAAGVVTEIRSKEGETVPVNQVVAVIDEAPAKGAEAAAPAAAAPDETAAAPGPRRAGARTTAGRRGRAAPASARSRRQRGGRAVSRRVEATAVVAARPEDRGRARRGHQPGRGSGIGGRVTKQDILDYIESPGPEAAAPAVQPGPAPAAAGPVVKAGPGDESSR